MLTEPNMHTTAAQPYPMRALLQSPDTRRIRWLRVFAFALPLSVAASSAALLIRIGQIEAPPDGAFLDALHQPGSMT